MHGFIEYNFSRIDIELQVLNSGKEFEQTINI